MAVVGGPREAKAKIVQLLADTPAGRRRPSDAEWRRIFGESKRVRIGRLLRQAWFRADTPRELKFVRTMYVLYGFADPIIGEGYRPEELNP